VLSEDLARAGIRFTEITDRLFVIHGNNRSRSPFSNAFLVVDTVNVLFDAGCGAGILETLCATVRVDRLFLSHSHLDHTAGSKLVSRLASSEIMVPEQSSESISSADLLARRFVGEELAPLWMETYPPLTGFEDFDISGTYDHAYELATGHMRFTAIATPGHLEDHYCFFEPDLGILLGFDIDLSPFGPWYGNPESDIEAFRSSIAHIRGLDVQVYLSSHARPLKPPYIERRLSAYEQAFDERDSQILGILSEVSSMTLEEIVRRSPFYDADHANLADELLWFGEEQMVLKHLERLVSRGMAARHGTLYHAGR